VSGRPAIQVGTRKSALARRQAGRVAERLEALGVAVELVLLDTEGDRDRTTPLPEIGGRGVFTEWLERALRERAVDAAVHSLKDLPTAGAPGLKLAAILDRADPRDVLISRQPWTLAGLPVGAVVGTSSARRSAQLLAARPDLRLAPLRGNVDTRVGKALSGEYDAVVIAAAGVLRLGLTSAVREYLDLDVMLPAPGQGALAVQCRDQDDETGALLARLDEPLVRAAAEAERAFLEGVGGGCAAPVAAYAAPDDAGRLALRGLVTDPKGTVRVRVVGEAPPSEARALGLTLAREALARGAGRLVA
jgi:hydroxymethylbilane synthase